LRAYQWLAEMLGVKMRYYVPPSNALRRALNVFSLSHYGPNRLIGKARRLRDLCLHFPELARHYRQQLQRRPIAADLILVELTVT
jgi:hypothetical protein